MASPGPGTDSARLALRSRVTYAIRSFFHDRGYLEIETPVRVATPALELHIDAEPAGDHWLRTSPELHMKRLLAAGLDRLFQMGPCFRRGERGDLHNPEYTMLEWYRAGVGYEELVEETQAMILAAARAANRRDTLSFKGHEIDLAAPWHILSISELFLRFAGWDPCRTFDADRFDLDLVERVEPGLPMDRPVVLTAYPVQRAALARVRPGDPPVAERWELYIAGVELANAYGELTDAREQRARFIQWAQARRLAGKPVYPLDEAFLAALESGMPVCSGIALGIDRLVMLLAESSSLDDVMAFRE